MNAARIAVWWHNYEAFSNIVLLVNGDLPREMPFTEKSSRNTFIIGAVHLLSITYKMCQIMCFYINTHLLSTEPFSFCDMVPPLLHSDVMLTFFHLWETLSCNAYGIWYLLRYMKKLENCTISNIIHGLQKWCKNLGILKVSDNLIFRGGRRRSRKRNSKNKRA